VIKKTEEHEINRDGKRLLRDALEPLGWVVNDVQEDYGIDSNIQVFDGKAPTGSWFHVQLKSSASSEYSSDRAFISQKLFIDHAQHYALEMRQPVLIVHVDTLSKKVYWYAPQLDVQLAATLKKTKADSVTVRVPTDQLLPETAPDLLEALEKIYLARASREVTSASAQFFAEVLEHFPDQAALYSGFQEKAHSLKLRKVASLFAERKFNEAKPLAETVLADPDSTVEIKFWAQIELQAIDYGQILHAGMPQIELYKAILAHTRRLQKLTSSGPKHLKFYSLIARHAAELQLMGHENFSFFMAMRQHLEHHGSPMMILGMYARRSELTRRIVSKYNRCVRLARYAANYPDRWMLGRALTNIVTAIGPYLVTLRSEGNIETERAFSGSALQVCKLAVWIGNEAGDPDAIGQAILSALSTTQSKDSDAYHWATSTAQTLRDPKNRSEILVVIERAVKRWKGEEVAGDYRGNTLWQVAQNIATALGIDLTNENDPLVKGLRIAVKDDSPEEILANCEHILVSLGATGPTARRIRQLFNVSTAGSKVVHCTLHDYHFEAKNQGTAYDEFKRAHCDSCPDKKPRAKDWRYDGEVRRTFEARHSEFVKRLAGTPSGFRFTNED